MVAQAVLARRPKPTPIFYLYEGQECVSQFRVDRLKSDSKNYFAWLRISLHKSFGGGITGLHADPMVSRKESTASQKRLNTLQVCKGILILIIFQLLFPFINTQRFRPPCRQVCRLAGQVRCLWRWRMTCSRSIHGWKKLKIPRLVFDWIFHLNFRAYIFHWESKLDGRLKDIECWVSSVAYWDSNWASARHTLNINT